MARWTAVLILVFITSLISEYIKEAHDRTGHVSYFLIHFFFMMLMAMLFILTIECLE